MSESQRISEFQSNQLVDVDIQAHLENGLCVYNNKLFDQCNKNQCNLFHQFIISCVAYFIWIILYGISK